MIRTIIGKGLIWILMTVVCLALWPLFIQASDIAPDPVGAFLMVWILPIFWLGLSFLIMIVPFDIVTPMDIREEDSRED